MLVLLYQYEITHEPLAEYQNYDMIQCEKNHLVLEIPSSLLFKSQDMEFFSVICI